MTAKEGNFLRKSDVIWVGASNIMALVTAVIIGLALPRFTSYETYAGYREYTLFIGFSGLLHFGFVNGVALRYGSLSLNELPYETFRVYSRVFAIAELIIAAILTAVLFIAPGGRITPLFFVAVNMLFENLRAYFSTITIFTGRFRTDAVLQFLYRGIQLLGFLLILWQGSGGWLGFLLFTTVLNAAILAIYAVCNSALIIPFVGSITDHGPDMIKTVRRGIPVLLGEQLSLLILGADSIFARLFFDAKQFSVYSFAVYIVVTAYTVINAANTVIFPYLKRIEEKDMAKRYRDLKNISLILSLIMSVFFFICPAAIRRLMPGYEDSIPFLCILAVTLFFRTLQGMACSNTMKALDMEKEYFRCCAVTCAAAVLSDTAVYMIWRDLRPIAVCSVLVFAFWYFLCDHLIRKRLKKNERFVDNNTCV